MEVIKTGQKALRRAIEIIKNGGVIVSPTDTVYGLLCDSANKKAVEKIFKIKKRPKTKPLAVFVHDLRIVKKLAEINEQQEKILKKYWPGKYTFVIKLKKMDIGCLSILATGKNGTVALRIPKYKFLNNLLKKINKPLAQTSVNISGKPALTKISEIMEQFQPRKPLRRTSDRLHNEQVDLIIDGGDLLKSKPSKIIDLTGNKKKTLR